MKPVDWIFPQDLYCVSCGRPLPLTGDRGLALCESCAEGIQWITGRRCSKCGRPLSNENPFDLCRSCAGAQGQSFSKGYACALYENNAAELIRDMKYREKAWYASTLAALMAERYLSLVDPGTGELPRHDYITAVPMAAKKKSLRGYDQAALLARALSRLIGIPCLPGGLRRIRETDVMSGLSEEERRQNLARAFAVDCDMIDMITDTRILLVDDVMTTGSSVNACSDTLIESGAASVDFIVFAIGADVRRGRPSGCG